MSTSRYVCSVLEECRTAHRLFRMDLLPGLFEEIQTLVNRMEAKLMDYSNMSYDLQRMKELKSKIRKLKATEEFLEANLDLSEVEDPDEDKKALWSRVMDDDDDGFV